MNYTLATHCAAPSGLMAVLALTSMNRSGAAANAAPLAVNPAVMKPDINGLTMADGTNHHPELLRLKHGTLVQRDVELGELRKSGTCVGLNG